MAAISAGEMPNNRYIPRFPNEETHLFTTGTLVRGSVPGEVKHLSTRRKRKQFKVFSFWSNFSRKREAIMIRKKTLAIP